MFISKKHLSRRTVLRGLGAAVSLPLLDAMIPAGTALAQTAARTETEARLLLSAARRRHRSLDAGRDGPRVRAAADLGAVRAVPSTT